MTGSPGFVTRLARLRSDVVRDRKALSARARDVDTLIAAAQRRALSDAEVILAVHVHGWYTALETLLERIARLLDDSVPEGPSWHAELVAQAAVEVPGLRPAVIAPKAIADLAELRKFRHFFRNAYVLNLDADRVLEQATRLDAIHSDVRSDLERFEQHVTETLANLSGA